MRWEERFRELARRQEGLVAKIHLRGINCTCEHWRRARRNGRWDILSPRVLRARGSPESDAQRALAAVLDASPGAMLHGPSALAWFGLSGYALRSLHICRPRAVSGAKAHLAKLHRLRDIRPHDLVVVGGVPTETALRAIWTEAARYASPRRLEVGVRRIGRLLDDAHVRKLVTWAALHEAVNDLRERGRSGTTIMKMLAEERPPGSCPTESRNEDRLEEILTKARAPALRRQPFLGGQEPIGRSDHRDPELPLAVEVNSLTYHSSPSDRLADQIRYQRMNDAGFTVAVVWEDDLWRRERSIVELIARARTHARAGERIVLHSRSCPWPDPNPGSGYSDA